MKASDKKENDYFHIIFISKMKSIPMTHIIFYNIQMLKS
jgi:hypothetical protein